MIYNKPIPIFEANFFLADLAAGFPDREVIRKWSVGTGETGKRLTEYYDIIIELENRLSETVCLVNDDLIALYEPMGKDEGGERQVETNFLANCFALCDHRAFACIDENESFRIIRDCAAELPRAIYNMLMKFSGIEFSKYEPVDTLAVVRAIKASDYSSSSKLNLIYAAMEPETYAEKLISLLTPVIAEFRKCAELYAPLLKLYEETLASFKSEMELIRYFWRTNFDFVEEIDIHPLIMLPIKSIMGIDTPFDNKGDVFIGALAYFTRKNIVYSARENELEATLDALSNKNRIKIIDELSHGERFGRELAEKLQVTTGSISRSMNMLISAGLVKMAGLGSRAYYSIDYRGVERLMQLLNQLFYDKK